MTQEEFDSFEAPSGNNDGRLKLYYGGSAFFFQGLYMDGHIPTAQNPSGWGDLEANFNNAIGSQDVLRSSADAWHMSGYDHTFSLDNTGTSDPAALMSLGPKAGGFWNIPICEISHDYASDLDGLKAWLDSPSDWFADGGPYESSWCACVDNVDSNGKRFGDQFPSDWEMNMSPNCNPSPAPAPNYKE